MPGTRTMKSILRSSRASARNRRMAPMNRGMAYVQRMRQGNPCTACSSAKTPTVASSTSSSRAPNPCFNPTGIGRKPPRPNPSNAGLKYPFGRKLSGAQPKDLKDPFPNPEVCGYIWPSMDPDRGPVQVCKQISSGPCGPGREVCGSSMPGDPPVCCAADSPQATSFAAQQARRTGPTTVDPFKLYGTQTIDPFAARRPRSGLAVRSNPTGIGRKPPRPNPTGVKSTFVYATSQSPISRDNPGGHGGGGRGGRGGRGGGGRHYGGWGRTGWGPWGAAGWGGYGYPGYYAAAWPYAYAWPYGQMEVVSRPYIPRPRAVMVPWTAYSPYLGYGMGFQRAAVVT